MAWLTHSLFIKFCWLQELCDYNGWNHLVVSIFFCLCFGHCFLEWINTFCDYNAYWLCTIRLAIYGLAVKGENNKDVGNVYYNWWIKFKLFRFVNVINISQNVLKDKPFKVHLNCVLSINIFLGCWIVYVRISKEQF